MKAVVAAFNQEKALVGAFSVITNLRMELFDALKQWPEEDGGGGGGGRGAAHDRASPAAVRAHVLRVPHPHGQVQISRYI